MRKATLLPTATRDLANILQYIARRSGHYSLAEKYVAKLRSACHKYASITGVIGKARPDLRPDLRSLPYENYVIFFRYNEGEFEVVNIIEGHRDIESYFGDT